MKANILKLIGIVLAMGTSVNASAQSLTFDDVPATRVDGALFLLAGLTLCVAARVALFLTRRGHIGRYAMPVWLTIPAALALIAIEGLIVGLTIGTNTEMLSWPFGYYGTFGAMFVAGIGLSLVLWYLGIKRPTIGTMHPASTHDRVPPSRREN